MNINRKHGWWLLVVLSLMGSLLLAGCGQTTAPEETAVTQIQADDTQTTQMITQTTQMTTQTRRQMTTQTTTIMMRKLLCSCCRPWKLLN
jgi:hypothetical protein